MASIAISPLGRMLMVRATVKGAAAEVAPLRTARELV
jgi:hypothetical protein